MTELGTISIPSGHVHIGDPCYVIADDASHGTKTRARLDAALAKLRRPHGEPFGCGIGVVVKHRDPNRPGKVSVEGNPGSPTHMHLNLSDEPAVRRDVNLGVVGVDAGILWMGDPTLVIGADAPHAVTAWQTFCDLTFSPQTPTFDPAQPLGAGVGVVSSTHSGDGTYDVTADLDTDGYVVNLTVTFEDPSWDEDDTCLSCGSTATLDADARCSDCEITDTDDEDED